MANANRAAGLAPVQYLNGAPWNGQARIYSIAAAYATKLAIGDPVISSGTADAAGVPGIVRAADTGAIRGVIVGLGALNQTAMANPQNLDQTIRPGAAQATTWYAMVVDDPNVVFEVQEGGTPLTAANVGQNTNLTIVDANNFLSQVVLDNADAATGATLQVKLLGLVQRVDNAFGQYAKWLVKINNHELAAGTAGV
jgi:hypothetical protein